MAQQLRVLIASVGIQVLFPVPTWRLTSIVTTVLKNLMSSPGLCGYQTRHDA